METNNFEAKKVMNDAIGPGAHLRQAREVKGISLEEIAKHLRLSTQRVNEIENDKYDNFGAGAFARGYLRAYARVVGIAENEILKEFNEMDFAATIKSKKPQLLNAKTHLVNPKNMRWVTYLVILILLVLIGYWWHTHKNTLKSATQMNSVTETNQASEVNSANTSTVPTAQQPITQPLPLQVITSGQSGKNNQSATDTTVTKPVAPNKNR